MKLICLHCSKSFEGNNAKFCSESCKNSHIVALEKRAQKAVREDSGHTKKLSKD